MTRADTTPGLDAFDPHRVATPATVLDLGRLEANLRILAGIADGAGVQVLLALKAFSSFAVADLIGSYLHGTAASGLWEARLGRTRFRGAVHTFAPGLKPDDLAEIQALSDHLVFNTMGQVQRFAPALDPEAGCRYGIRLNPRHSEVETPLYDPCAPWSRLGVPADQIAGGHVPAAIDGAMVHALCDQGFEPFDRLLAATETAFAPLFERLRWINLGGGQLLTAPDYPVAALVERLAAFRARSGLEVTLEPGTAVALNAGALVVEVLDTGWNDGHFAVLDGSATCHMPDVIEAPYTPEVAGAIIVAPGENTDPSDDRVVRLGGPTCLAGDVIGTYRFEKPLNVGDRLLVLDQGYYTTVKATTFNGTPLPDLVLWDPHTDRVEVVRRFGYEDFEARLS